MAERESRSYSRDWTKDKVQKKSCKGIEQVREDGRRKIKPFLLQNDLNRTFQKYSSSLSRQSSEIKSKKNWSPI